MKRTALFLLAFTALAAACNTKSGEPEQKPVPNEVTATDKSMSISPDLLAMKKDPVCDMPLSGGIQDTATYNSKLYGFCNEGCKKAFLEDPKEYIKE
jgi:YHS domain-containing protein